MIWLFIVFGLMILIPDLWYVIDVLREKEVDVKKQRFVILLLSLSNIVLFLCVSLLALILNDAIDLLKTL